MLKEKYAKKIGPILKSELALNNDMALPKLVKITLNICLGKKDEKEQEVIRKQLELISGQKCMPRKAKKSIASFKTRKGMVIGMSCSLRGDRMYDFLEKLLNITFARIRDFRGLDPRSLDSSGNLTIGFKEHIVFPEMVGEDTGALFGLEVTLVTSAGSRERGLAILKALGIPFKGIAPKIRAKGE